MTAHASLSASSAYRWINCPGSPREIAALPAELQQTDSVYAREGSAAHALAEIRLGGAKPKIGQWIDQSGHIALENYRSIHPFFEITQEMWDAIQLYLDVIRDETARLAYPDVMVEKRVYPIPFRPDLYGTADCILLELYGELVVIDFKYGKGIAVEVNDNPQLLYYALGALNMVGDDSAVSLVTLTVVQPRAEHPAGPIRSKSYPVEQLRDFERQLRLAVAATERPDAPLIPGKHCRFCPAAASCPALRQLAVSTALAEFPDGPTVRLPNPEDPDQMARALQLAEMIEQWPKAVRSMAFQSALRGKGPTGYKLVRGRANRKWKDGAEAVAPAECFEEVFKSPAQAEKFDKAFVAQWSVKPEGALTLVPESDRRPAVEAGNLQSEFPALPEEME
jgi:hypothetical protein